MANREISTTDVKNINTNAQQSQNHTTNEELKTLVERSGRGSGYFWWKKDGDEDLVTLGSDIYRVADVWEAWEHLMGKSPSEWGDILQDLQKNLDGKNIDDVTYRFNWNSEKGIKDFPMQLLCTLAFNCTDSH